MKEKGTCVAAGKCVGTTYRKVSEETQKFGMFLEKSFQTVREEMKMIFARMGNLFKRVKTDGKLAHWEMKQRDNFAKLGEEIYRKKKSELNKLFNEENLKDIFAQIETDEEKIHEMKGINDKQRRRMEEMILFKHAIKELKSSEVKMRRVALRVLERLGKKEAISYLVELLNDPEPEIRSKASEIIQDLSEIAQGKTVLSEE
jgi:hypothetical protein